MPLYACRWPNGDVSVVQAEDEDDALFLLDEFGAAEVGYLTELPDGFLVDFQLQDDGEFGVQFSEETDEAVMKLYPLLDAAFEAASVAAEAGEDDGGAGVEEAVRQERARLGLLAEADENVKH